MKSAFVCLLFSLNAVQAATLVVQVSDRGNKPAANAVVYAVPVGVAAPNKTAQDAPQTVTQNQYKFEPYVSIVQTGSKMRFPNKDAAEHHLRVLSGPSNFEFKVYRKEPDPVLLDKLGLVTIHCLLHDWMSAHIYVVNTPYFGKSSNKGSVVLEGLPVGEYDVTVTHPLALIAPQVKRVKLTDAVVQTLEHNLGFTPRNEPTTRQPPSSYNY
jgi:plastocyanin